MGRFTIDSSFAVHEDSGGYRDATGQDDVLATSNRRVNAGIANAIDFYSVDSTTEEIDPVRSKR